MPYLTSERKDFLLSNKMETPGDLNYLLTALILEYWENSKQNYQSCNDIIGALESCKLEAYRRLVTPYENVKILTNGDVYDLQ